MLSCEATERWPYSYKTPRTVTGLPNIVTMADEELRDILGEDAGKPEEKVVETPVEEKKEPEEDPELKKKREEKANLDKAIKQSQDVLRGVRTQIKKAKAGEVEDEEDEEVPQINLKDPAARAWKREIDNSNAPNTELLNQAKEERRKFALRQFLADKPALASSPEKLKETMEMYRKIGTATELTTEGILEDLDRAYAATHYQELRNGTRQDRIDRNREDQIFVDPAISRGSTTYPDEKPKKRVYSEEERDILKQWERSGAPTLDEK